MTPRILLGLVALLALLAAPAAGGAKVRAPGCPAATVAHVAKGGAAACLPRSRPAAGLPGFEAAARRALARFDDRLPRAGRRAASAKTLLGRLAEAAPRARARAAGGVRAADIEGIGD